MRLSTKTTEKYTHIASTALNVFLRHGYRRVNMVEIAEAAGISRPGLYLYFKTKEEIFCAAMLHHTDLLLEQIARGIGAAGDIKQKFLFAFEIWTIESFELTLISPEAKEISDCSYSFASAAFDESYHNLETLLVSSLERSLALDELKIRLTPRQTVTLVVGAVRGFKLVAKSGGELRTMIRNLLDVVFGS
jgi:TetR/AcrR family transcriptional regulator, regulator of autoinduction and epiphytic fitness